MKKFRDGLVTVIMVVGLMGFIGYDFLTPVKGNAEEKAVKKEAKVAKKAAAPAKKVVKKDPAPEVTVATPIAILGKKVSVDIMGAGFDADEEVRVLFTDAEGMQTDIGYALDPAPKGNKSGAWTTTWAVDEFIKAKLVQAGVYTLTVTNNEFKPIAQTAIVFKAAPAKPASDKEGKSEKGEKKEKK